MDGNRTFKFALKGKIDGVDISPATISLPLFVEYNDQVLRFLRGSGKGVDLVDSRVGIEEGSYRLAVSVAAAIATMVEPDFTRLQKQDSLGDIDPVRAKIVREWQSSARKFSDRVYTIEESDVPGFSSVSISAQSDFHRLADDQWVRVEKYVTGQIYEAGGKSQANLHVVLEGTNQTIIVDAPEELLRNDQKNRLYHEARLHVTAQQNLRTGKLAGYQLLGFSEFSRGFDEAAYQRFVERGTKAWAGVGEAGAWVEEQRGGGEV